MKQSELHGLRAASGATKSKLSRKKEKKEREKNKRHRESSLAKKIPSPSRKSQKGQMAFTQNHGALQSRTASLFPFAVEDRLSVASAPDNCASGPKFVVTNFESSVTFSVSMALARR